MQAPAESLPELPGTRGSAAQTAELPGVRRVSPTVFYVLFLVLLLGGLIASGMVGTFYASPTAVWHALADRITGTPGDVRARIITELRIPRALLAALVGAALALVGAVLQALVGNPLADPTILGGSSGAGLGAVIVIIAGGEGALGLSGIAVGAFVGAAVGFAVTFLLAWQRGGLAPLRLVLAGIAVSYLFSSLTQLVVLRAPDDHRLRSAVFWQLGSVADADWSSLWLPLGVLSLGTLLVCLRARRLDALSLGELTAYALGIHPGRLRTELFVLTALVTGVCVAVAGGVGFVALVIPHAVRLCLGPGHRRLLPACVLAGSAFLVWADIAARVVALPSELPLGVVTALVGAPVFGLLVRRRMRSTA